MRTMKHFALATMAAAALALAGCGGGGSGTSSMAPTMPTTPEPPAPTAAAVTLPSDGNMYLDEMDTTLADTTAPVMLAHGRNARGGRVHAHLHGRALRDHDRGRRRRSDPVRSRRPTRPLP